jgi:predicted transcriptional regulator
MARRKKPLQDPVENDGRPQGNNGFDPEKLADFVGRIENIQGEIDDINAEARERTQPLREDIAAIKREATDLGIGRIELAAVLRKRRLEHRAAHVSDTLDLAERTNFEEYLASLERLAEQVGPLGEAARDHARAGA